MICPACGTKECCGSVMAGKIESLREALESALQTAEFEKHPYRTWQTEARHAIAKAKGE